MAKIVVTVDDFDGSAGAETVTFSLDGDLYEVDLSASNLEKMRQELAPFIAKARRIPTPRRRRKNT